MRTFFSWFFYILGVIFFVLILAGVYVFVADPFGIREFASLMTSTPKETVQETAVDGKVVKEPVQADANPYLSDAQEAALENVGINPAALPTSVSDTQKTCLINAVGEARANEIKAGAMPTPMEIIKAKSCL